MPSQAVLQWLLRIEYITAFLVAPLLFLIPAPYGRYTRDGWGPRIHVRTAWVLMEAPAGLMLLYSFLATHKHAGTSSTLGWMFAGLFLTHYLQRTVVYPLRMRDGGQGKPILTVAMGMTFNLMNGLLNGHALASMSPETTMSFLRWLGVIAFVSGFLINLHADAVLRSLRAPGETGYKIPHGGAFRWVSAANYFGEVLEWWGFAIATGTSASLAFALFTSANLIPRGWTHHQFYKRKFHNYPAERRAVIPFLL